ncbi:efflux transporter outer membrane subunit [Pararobbsia silviterrae]|uniref:Efflux transporter outer membrane subunit n=1 Tax=Pararobbsia silviterrae TaxID=1792498 RepID=A0A494Y0L4_9BURK|nr:efflux transporter outer membrane subunit [Pararobbsia silviterrae]
MTRSIAALALGAAGCLAACVSFTPPYEAPPLPVAPQYPPGTATGETEAPRAAELDWRHYFADPELQRLIDTALDNNRDLRIAIARVEEARATYGIRRADAFPTIGVQADLSRARVPADLSGIGVPVTATQYQAGIGLSTWELDFWGRVASLNDAALQTYLATDAARRATELTIVAQVAENYLNLCELDERLALTQATIDSRAHSYRLYRHRYEVGATSRLDLTQVETLLHQAQTLGAQLKQARATQAHALALVVGAPVELPDSGLRLDDGVMPQEVFAGLPSDLLIDRPDIVSAEFELRAANANIGAARADFFPRITLTGQLGTASASLDSLFTGPSRAWSFGPSVSLPIFDMGRRQAQLEVTQARQEQAVASYEKAVQSAFRDVADAITARTWLAEQLDVLRASVATQAERSALAQQRYDHGAAPFLEVLDAQRDQLSAQQQLVQTHRALLSSRVTLFTALGGGSRAAAASSASEPVAR